MEHMDRHETEANYWKQRIDRNRDEIRKIMKSPSARPDPFTGTEGKELERRIDKLERCCDRATGG